MTEYREYRVVTKGRHPTYPKPWGIVGTKMVVPSLRRAKAIFRIRPFYLPKLDPRTKPHEVDWKIEYRTVTVTTGPWRKHKDSP